MSIVNDWSRKISVNRFPTIETRKKRRIVIIVDDSTDSTDAFNFAFKHIINPENDVVLLVHAYKETILNTAPYYYHPKVTQHEFERNSISTRKMFMYRFFEKLDTKKVLYKGYIVKSKDVRSTLLNTLKNLQPEFVVVGSREGNKIERMFFRSVSRYLMNHAKCPVLIV